MPTMNLNVQRKQIDAAILAGNANRYGAYLDTNAQLAIECGLPGLTTDEVRKALRRLVRIGRVEVTHGPHYEATNQRFLWAPTVHERAEQVQPAQDETDAERAACVAGFEMAHEWAATLCLENPGQMQRLLADDGPFQKFLEGVNEALHAALSDAALD